MTLRDFKRKGIISGSQKVLILESPYVIDSELYVLYDDKFSGMPSHVEDTEVISIYTDKNRKNTLIIEIDKVQD